MPLLPAEAPGLLRGFLVGERPVILAVSGGPDSVALMHLAAACRDQASPERVVATVDHALRPESRREAEAVAGWAAALGLRHRTLEWRGEKPRTRVQERARRARYDLLVALAREIGADTILTAHTRDDQAETVLMRLAAGSGIEGLAGMRPRLDLGGVVLGRPFLGLAKAGLLEACRAARWPYIEDPSNRDTRYGRVRARKLLAAMAPEGLSPVRLARLALRAGRAEAALDAAAEAAFARITLALGPDQVELDPKAWLAEPDELALRILRLAIAQVAPGDRPRRLLKLEQLADDLRDALARSGAPFAATLAGALVRLDTAGRLLVTPAPPRRAGRP